MTAATATTQNGGTGRENTVAPILGATSSSATWTVLRPPRTRLRKCFSGGHERVLRFLTCGLFGVLILALLLAFVRRTAFGPRLGSLLEHPFITSTPRILLTGDALYFVTQLV